MKKIQLTLLLLIASICFAQHSISGNFSPAKDFKWLIAYQLTPSGQNYVADTGIKDGNFNLTLPASAQPGMYRLVYAVPQDEFYIDIIYNRTEDIEFNFSLQEGISFITSEENIFYQTYFSEISEVENKLLDFYQTGTKTKDEYENIIAELKSTQERFEALRTESIAHQFIKANVPYLPQEFENIEVYLKHKKESYFKNIALDNPILQASGFLKDKIANYAFSAISPSLTSQAKMEKEINSNIDTIKKEITSTPLSFQVVVFYHVWKLAGLSNLNEVSDYIYESYLKDMATLKGDQTIVDEMATYTRLRIGAKSPEVTWEKNGKTQRLSDLKGKENYILVFWSSTCSHCLKEVPALHKELANYTDVKVIAIGLEDDKANWKTESSKMPGFEHAITLEKWESAYAQQFNITQTPSYFILDSEKRFVAKPENDKAVVEFLKSRKL